MLLSIVFVRILFIYLFLPPNFVVHLSQKIVSLSSSNFHSIFGFIRNRVPPLFSVITQPWRHPGAILCFHVIIHIFISILHKLTKFNTHKLQVISQHTWQSLSPCASRRARARASKFKIAQNPNLINGEHVSGHFEHFKIFRLYVSARALCARAARMNGKNSKFSHDLDAWYDNWQFPFICSHSWPFIRPCERVKV